MTEILAERLEIATGALLAAMGMSEAHAARSATAIVLADRWGIGSHGILRVPSYLRRLEAGGIDARAELRPARVTTSVLTYDGGTGLGHWQAWRAAEDAIRLSAATGVGVVAVGNSSHCGALGVYATVLRDAGCAGLIFSNGPAAMAPWGGSKPVVSTSPLAGAVPSTGGGAIIDMATSAVTRGRIAQYARSSQPLEVGWALDREGRPTTDAAEALQGMIAPLGGAKGFALAFLIEALTGGSIGPALSRDVVDPFDGARAMEPQRISHLVIAIDPGAIDLDGNHDERLRMLELEVEHSGGRIPGHTRTSAPDAHVELDPVLRADLLDWARRIGARAAEDVLTIE